ncbi:MAG: zinc ribbon domain-containing protein [Thermoplasmata archaeon]|nr:MAG: zinc ribbon domain-containing protein [Thermoplasmata archaeon]
MSKKMILASLTILLAFFGLMIPAFTQADIGTTGGTTDLKSDMEMMSGIPVHGGGHFTWKVSGPAANELRAAIILNWDTPSGQQPPDGLLQKAEVDRYLQALEYYLEHSDLQYQGAILRSFALLNKDSTRDTKGLIGTSNASTGDIEIRFYYDAWIPTGDQEIVLSDTIIADAIYVPVNETFRGTYKVEHWEYMINIGNFEGMDIGKGDYLLIRTPFGEIYRYSATFKADSNPNEKLNYEEFSWVECPLVLFVMIVIFGYLVVTMPGRFRRHDVMKIVKLHTLMKILFLILILLYFFAGFGGIFVSGIYLWLMSVAFLFVSIVLSKTMYENAARVTTMPKKPEPTAADEGQLAGTEEAESEMEEERKDVQCATCGEIFKMDKKFRVSSAPCPACGSIGAVDLGVGEEEPLPGDLEPPPEPPPTPPPPSLDEDEDL